MPSYAGRYRSRLFNFLSQQTNRWGDKGERALRQIKVGAIWGTQILLYPVYLMFQATRLVGKQLQQAIRHTIDPVAKHLPPADSPVRRVLETAVTSSPNLELSEDRDRFESTENKQAIRGIASVLGTHDIVLVTAENQIANVFDRDRQEEIQKIISLEVSDYLHHQIAAKEAQPKLTNRLSLLDDRPHLLPPLRFFRKAMAWVQTSPLATVVNLFQEEAVLLNLEVKTKYLKQKSQSLKSKSARLKVKSEELKSKHQQSASNTIELTEPQPPAIILKLDSAIAQLETGNLAGAIELTDTLVHRSQEFLQIVKVRFANTSDLSRSQPQTDAIDDSQPNLYTIQALIKGAIDYFFGKSENRELASPAETAIGVTEVAIEEENPWLTESELFGEPVIVKPRSINRTKTDSAGSQKFTLPGKKSAHTDYLPPKNIDTDNSKPGKRNKSSDRNYPAAQPKQKPARSANPPLPDARPTSYTNIDSDRDDFYYYDPEADWIEIKAKPAGYVKHPLEQILELLDKAMLWLEEIIIEIWQWLRGSSNSKK